MRHRITEDDKATIRRMHGLRYSVVDIAKVIGGSPSAVYNHLRQMGLLVKDCRAKQFSTLYHGAGMGTDEVEFGSAMSLWKAHHPHEQPGPREIIQVAKSLGYRKVQS